MGNTETLKILESPKEECTVSGRRIVDICYFIEQLKTIDSHGVNFGCGLQNLVLKSELKRGLKSGFLFECNMCAMKQTVWCEPEDNHNAMDLNTAAVAGVMSSGGAFGTLEKVMGSMNVRCMSSKTFDKHHDKVCAGWEEAALEQMRLAAEEEAALARQRGDVSCDNVPLITVVADGSWAKRSYRKNYNSLSGMAAIVGFYTKKVLYFGVKNKYCVNCARTKQSKTPKRNHVCFKNWSGSSSSMEAATIVEGFLTSEEMYGIRYAKIIADGDSSVYHNVLQARPYDNFTVEKVECRNHLMRNYCNKIRDIVTASSRTIEPGLDRSLHIQMRKLIGSRLLRCRAAVTKAINHRKKENNPRKVELLKKDILNGPSHVFGEHRNCSELGYFCTGPKEGERNFVPDLVKTKLYAKLMEIVNNLADFSKHLILNVDSNIVESYNSIIARFTGGKRINYIQKRSYQGRCAAAVVSHNTGKAFYNLHKSLTKQSPAGYSKDFEIKSKRKVEQAALRLAKVPKIRRRLPMSSSDDQHYGPSAQKPDMDTVTYDRKVKEFIVKLSKTDEERRSLERATVDQGESSTWYEERRIRLTASNFGMICNRRPFTSCASAVQNMLYSTVETSSMRYGKEHEKIAIEELSKAIGLKIKPCGLFIDSEIPFLAATPDGLVEEDGIVEIKCPSSGLNVTPQQIIKEKMGLVGSFWQSSKTENIYKIKEKHPYHLQVQGQLHVTKRAYCLFAIWTPHGLHYEKILRNDCLWDNYMKDKLTTFYMECLLPEIVDPRRRRNMEIREPDSILKAQKERQTTVLAEPLL